MDNIRSKVSDQYDSNIVILNSKAYYYYYYLCFYEKCIFCLRNISYFYFNYVLIIPITKNNIRQMFSEHFLFFFFFVFFSFIFTWKSKEVISKRRTEQAEQTCNNTSFSPVWITIISGEIESLIARIRYDDDQLAPVRK